MEQRVALLLYHKCTLLHVHPFTIFSIAALSSPVATVVPLPPEVPVVPVVPVVPTVPVAPVVPVLPAGFISDEFFWQEAKHIAAHITGYNSFFILLRFNALGAFSS
jgi:hypothetical protein